MILKPPPALRLDFLFKLDFFLDSRPRSLAFFWAGRAGGRSGVRSFGRRRAWGSTSRTQAYPPRRRWVGRLACVKRATLPPPSAARGGFAFFVGGAFRYAPAPPTKKNAKYGLRPAYLSPLFARRLPSLPLSLSPLPTPAHRQPPHTRPPQSCSFFVAVPSPLSPAARFGSPSSRPLPPPLASGFGWGGLAGGRAVRVRRRSGCVLWLAVVWFCVRGGRGSAVGFSFARFRGRLGCVSFLGGSASGGRGSVLSFGSGASLWGSGVAVLFWVRCFALGWRFLYYSISLFSLFLLFFSVFVLFFTYFLHII